MNIEIEGEIKKSYINEKLSQYYYNREAFEGKTVIITFTEEDIISKFITNSRDTINDYVNKAVIDKMTEANQAWGIKIKYKITSKELINNELVFKCKINKCTSPL